MKHHEVLPKLKATAMAVRSCFENSELSEHSVSSNLEVQTLELRAPAPISNAATKFSDLPDCAYVRQPTLQALFACSKATLWRWVKSGRLPPPIKLGLRISAWNVGKLRAHLKTIELSGKVNSTGGGK